MSPQNLGMENELLNSISNASRQPQQQQQQGNTSGGASAFDLFEDNDNDYSMDSQHEIDLSPQNFSDGSNTFPGMGSDNSNPLQGLHEHDTSGETFFQLTVICFVHWMHCVETYCFDLWQCRSLDAFYRNLIKYHNGCIKLMD